MPHWGSCYSREEYEKYCIKIARLFDQGVDRLGLRERFGIGKNQLNYLVSRGREYSAAKAGKDAVQNSTGRITARAVSP